MTICVFPGNTWGRYSTHSRIFLKILLTKYLHSQCPSIIVWNKSLVYEGLQKSSMFITIFHFTININDLNHTLIEFNIKQQIWGTYESVLQSCQRSCQIMWRWSPGNLTAGYIDNLGEYICEDANVGRGTAPSVEYSIG